MNPNIRNKFSNHKRVQQLIEGPTMTQQHMAAETDINNIVSKYLKTGVLGNPTNPRRAMFGDFTSVDYQNMQNQIADIDNEFSALPSRLRKKFGNDPYQLVRWIEDPRNYAEAVKLGLILPETPEIDLETQAQNAGETPAPKADPESQPQHKKE